MTDRYAVVGNPLSHTKSPFIHTLFARQTGQDLVYEAIEAPKDGFVECIETFFSEGGKGCSITVPFKEEAYRFATQLTERAKQAGAVNTLKKLDDGGVLGDNTDGEGLVQDLLQNQVCLEGARILLVGAGGAARGVILPLLNQKPASLVIANRTQEKAERLQSVFSDFGPVSSMSLAETAGQSFDVIINSTSASLSGDTPGLPEAVVQPQAVFYDMVYGSGLTSSNQWALEQGAGKVLDGLGMLVGQAAESFTIWRGLRPGTKQVLRELRRNLGG
ncbi:shikimate dehydrogenase [Parasalinivibrio latis]